jgi:ribosomal 30S subunit maturation factor RimM
MKKVIIPGVLLLLMLFSGRVSLAEDEKIKGKLVGEDCARQLKLGECFLEKAYPMVLFTDEGDYYRIELMGMDIVELDRAFGRNVELTGTLAGGKIKVKGIEVLEPIGEREFFKGCL